MKGVVEPGRDPPRKFLQIHQTQKVIFQTDLSFFLSYLDPNFKKMKINLFCYYLKKEKRISPPSKKTCVEQ
jgi:hypothetical protein